MENPNPKEHTVPTSTATNVYRDRARAEAGPRSEDPSAAVDRVEGYLLTHVGLTPAMSRTVGLLVDRAAEYADWQVVDCNRPLSDGEQFYVGDLEAELGELVALLPWPGAEAFRLDLSGDPRYAVVRLHTVDEDPVQGEGVVIA